MDPWFQVAPKKVTLEDFEKAEESKDDQPYPYRVYECLTDPEVLAVWYDSQHRVMDTAYATGSLTRYYFDTQEHICITHPEEVLYDWDLFEFD